MAYSLAEIVTRFGGELLDDNGVTVYRRGPPVERAGPQEIAFVSQAKYLRDIGLLAGRRADPAARGARQRQASAHRQRQPLSFISHAYRRC